MSLAQNIRAAREAKRLSRSALGKLLDVDGHTIYRWERGERAPREESKHALAKVLGCSVADFYKET